MITMQNLGKATDGAHDKVWRIWKQNMDCHFLNVSKSNTVEV